MYRRRLALCLLVAAGVHVAVAVALGRLPSHPLPTHRSVVVQLTAPPPPAEPPAEPPPEPPKPPPPEPAPPKSTDRPLDAQQKPQALRLGARADRAHDTARSERAVVTDNATDVPTFGFSLESTSASGSGPAMPVGNTLQVPGGGALADKPLPLAAPVAARDVTKDPLPRGDCHGVYTEAATAAGIEGVVVVAVVIDAAGNAGDIAVIEALGHGLDEAAIAAVKHCKFRPGEHNGRPVAVRIPRFKVRFVLPGAGE